MAEVSLTDAAVTMAAVMRRMTIEFLHDRATCIKSLEHTLVCTYAGPLLTGDMSKALKSLKGTRQVCEEALTALAPGASDNMEDEYQRAMRGFRKGQPEEKGGE